MVLKFGYVLDLNHRNILAQIWFQSEVRLKLIVPVEDTPKMAYS